MSEKTRRVFDWILEVLWLTAVVWVTLYFNIYTKDSRIFEPQKALILRTLVTLMLTVWAIRVLEEHRERLQAARWWRWAVGAVVAVSAALSLGLFALAAATWQGGPLDGMLGYVGVDRMLPLGPTPFPVLAGILEIPLNFIVLLGAGLALVAAIAALRTSWKEALRTAMVIPALAYIAVHVISTIGSVFPLASLYGGYVRQQGTLSVLAYIGLAFILATTLRRREQLERLITVILLTSVPAALYGIVQRMGVDPLPWMGNVEARVASTMGNAIFIAAYLIMVLPLTGYRLLSTWKQIQAGPAPEEAPTGRHSLRWYRPALIAYGVTIGLLLVLLVIGLPIYISSQTAYLRQQGLPTSEVMSWGQWGDGLLLTLGVALLTVALPAFFYALLMLVRRGRRLLLTLGGGAVFVLGVAIKLLGPALVSDLAGKSIWNALSWGVLLILGLAWFLLSIWPERWRPYIHLVAVVMAFAVAVVLLLLPMTRDSGFAWAGYLIGLCSLAIVSAFLHYRYPWGYDALWTDAVYLLLAGQSVLLYVAILLYLPTRPYPNLNTLTYPLALFLFLASCFIVLARRVVGRVGYLAQLLGYIVLFGLQVLCIFLTQSRGPMVGLLAGMGGFVLLTLWIVAKNGRRQEGAERVSFWRIFGLAGGEWGRAAAFWALVVLHLLAIVLVLAGVVVLLSGNPLSLLGLAAIPWWAILTPGLVLLAVAVVWTALALFGPGLPRSPGRWLGALAANLVPVAGPFVAMVTVKRGRRWLWLSMLFLVLLAGLGLAIFNLPDTPLLGDLVMDNPQTAAFVDHTIKPLKAIPYIGRLGRIFAAGETTGRVRILIWFGDEIGTGAVGMIQHHPLRTLIGYGPEAMHVAYNPYYPPELAHVEKRNASPDRSHNAIFDELVTMGILGLAAYLFYFISFFVLVWKLLWRSPNAMWQALGIGLFSLGLAHFVETLTGIPIVSTRMYMWLAIGVAVALTLMPPFRAEEAPVAEVVEAAGPALSRRQRRRAERLRRTGIPTLWMLGYIVIGLAAAILTYRVNLKPMVADMLFWQAKQLEAQVAAYQKQLPQLTIDQQKQQAQALIKQYTRESLDSLQQAIYLMPEEDFYFLSLAQVYLSGTAQATAGVEELFRSTEKAILRARDLSPLNTDHYRNMAALHLAWFGTASAPRNPESMAKAIAYNEQALSLTGNNADLHNRLAQAYILAASSTAEVRQSVLPKAQQWLRDWEKYHHTSGGRAGDIHLPVVARYREEAGRLLESGALQRGFWVLAAAELEYSLFLDEQYSSTYLTLGDLYRTLGMPAEAALAYERGVLLKRDLLSDAQFESRLKALAGAGELEPLFRAYGAVAAQAEEALAGLAPDAPKSTRDKWHTQAGDAYQVLAYMSIQRGNNVEAIAYYEKALSHRETYEAHKNLAILYDRVGQYEQALAQAQTALETAQAKKDENDVQALQNFIQQVQTKQEQLRQAQERVQANPTDYQAHYDLAALYRQGNRLEEAIAEAQLAVQYVPRSQATEVVKAYNLLGQCAFQAKEYELAEQAYGEALKAERGDFTALYGLAQVYKAQGRIAEARARAQAALEVVPENRRAEVQAFLDGLGQE